MQQSRARAAAQQLGSLDVQLAALSHMTIPELVAKYFELYGEPTRTRNKAYLLKRLTWRVQEIAEGGLSQGATEIITKLGDQLPENWRRRMAELTPRADVARDPRLPPAGTKLSRVYRGVEYTATVHADGIEYRDRHYRSLSAVARAITGSAWNGFTFFGMSTTDKAEP